MSPLVCPPIGSPLPRSVENGPTARAIRWIVPSCLAGGGGKIEERAQIFDRATPCAICAGACIEALDDRRLACRRTGQRRRPRVRPGVAAKREGEKLDHLQRLKPAAPCSRSVAAWIGLTTRRYQTGEFDHDGHISRRGDRHLRGLFYEAAAVIPTHCSAESSLRTWGPAGPVPYRVHAQHSQFRRRSGMTPRAHPHPK